MRRGLVVGVLVVALTGCAAPPAAPTLDEVQAERSRTVTEQWRLTADAAAEYLEAEWPEAVYPPLRFERWVEPERQLADLLQCMNRVVDRTAGSIGETGLLVLNPRPTGEPAWELPVAQVR